MDDGDNRNGVDLRAFDGNTVEGEIGEVIGINVVVSTCVEIEGGIFDDI